MRYGAKAGTNPFAKEVTKALLGQIHKAMGFEAGVYAFTHPRLVLIGCEAAHRTYPMELAQATGLAPLYLTYAKLDDHVPVAFAPHVWVGTHGGFP